MLIAMPQLVFDVPQAPDVCWRAFTDPNLFAAWMPGLRRATVIATNADGLPGEVHFEYSESLTYSLRYAYDVAAREVRWEPRVGARDAVRGFARFAAHPPGTRMTYKLEQGVGRLAGDLALGGPHTVASAFIKWLGGA
jgi:hypothetical protein